jgi:MFS family permease
MLVAAGAAFLALLETTVASLAVADAQGDFAGASVGGATWIITIYAVTVAAFLAPAGRVADVVERRTLMLAGGGASTAMSLACALAPSLGFLLVARALQGAGAAAMIPASRGVVLVDSPPERRAAASGGVLVDALGLAHRLCPAAPRRDRQSRRCQRLATRPRRFRRGALPPGALPPGAARAG